MYSKQLSPADGETVRLQQAAERRVREFYRRQQQAVHPREVAPNPAASPASATDTAAHSTPPPPERERNFPSKGADTWLLLALLWVLLEEDGDPLLLLALAYILL